MGNERALSGSLGIIRKGGCIAIICRGANAKL